MTLLPRPSPCRQFAVPYTRTPGSGHLLPVGPRQLEHTAADLLTLPRNLDIAGRWVYPVQAVPDPRVSAAPGSTPEAISDVSFAFL